MPTALRLATRGSPLARLQAMIVADVVRERLGRASELVIVESSGDVDKVTPIHELSGRGVFTTEVDKAVAEGRADLAVHSAKDLPSSALSEGMALFAIPSRGEVRDCLVGGRLFELPEGSTVYTGAIRRRVQLQHLRPDLCFAEIRGNVGTRLDKSKDKGCLVVAYVALQRLGLSERADEVLGLDTMLPQVGQGAIALCGRADDEATRALAEELDDPGAHLSVSAERAFLQRLGGGCDAPVGAYAIASGTAVELHAVMAEQSGALHRSSLSGSDPVGLGHRLADELASTIG